MGWGILLIVLGLALLMTEVFVPSGGLILILALAALFTGVVLIFYTPESDGGGTRAGLITLIILVVLSPVLAGIALYFWPHTPMAKLLRLKAPEAEAAAGLAAVAPDLERYRGQIGRTLTPHQPSGQIEIAGHRLESLSEAGFIEAGALVKVVAVQNRLLHVRPMSAPGTSVADGLDLPEDLLT